MLEGRVVVITHARHFVGPATAALIAGYGATVVCPVSYTHLTLPTKA